MKNKQLLLTVAIAGLFGVSSMAFSNNSQQNAVDNLLDAGKQLGSEMYNEHPKKTIAGSGFLMLGAINRLWSGPSDYNFFKIDKSIPGKLVYKLRISAPVTGATILGYTLYQCYKKTA